MKYSKEQIEFCLDILKNKEGCFDLYGDADLCSRCCIKKECDALPNVHIASRASRQIAIKIIKEILY